MARVSSIGFLVGLVVGPWACFNPGETDEDTTTTAVDTTAGAIACMQGDLRACNCPDGSASTRACLPDGSDFGACECGGASTGAPATTTDAGTTTSVDESTSAPATDGGSTGASTSGVTGDSTGAASTGGGGCLPSDECSESIPCAAVGETCIDCICVAAGSLYGPCDSCEPGEIQAMLQGVDGYCFCSPSCSMGMPCPDPGTGASAECAVSGMMGEMNCVLVCTDNGQCPTGSQCVPVPDAMLSVCTAPV